MAQENFEITDFGIKCKSCKSILRFDLNDTSYNRKIDSDNFFTKHNNSCWKGED